MQTKPKQESLILNWPSTAAEAALIQNSLRNKVLLKNDFKKLETIAGVDCSYDIKNNLSKAVIVIMNINELKPFEISTAQTPTTFPYIPGFLSFREIPVILEALNKFKTKIDLFMVDGQGIAHPRRFGIASHLGILLNKPAVGVAKSRLVGHYLEPNLEKGEHNPLLDKNEMIGTVLRSKNKVKPLFISPGHKIDHKTSLEIVLKCLKAHRLPEPTRIADKISKDKNFNNQIL